METKLGGEIFQQINQTWHPDDKVREVTRVMTQTYKDQNYQSGEGSLNLADKLADGLFVVCCIANQTGVDLTCALEGNLEKIDRIKTGTEPTISSLIKQQRINRHLAYGDIMNSTELEGILTFLRDAEQLKNTIRSAVTSNGRHESTAEHTWRLCLMVLIFEKSYPKINILKLLKICIIHDLGEAINGDISAVNQVRGVDKGVEERKDLKQLIKPLFSELQNEILSLWDEYENASSSEALLAKAFDKIETLLQHNQGKISENIDYRFNLNYGKKYTDFDELTSNLRSIIDKDTRRLAEKGGTI